MFSTRGYRRGVRRTAADCMFLFVGGTIRRKGADVLLQAYAEAFSDDDDVTLVFKETGASSFYRHNNLLPKVQRMARRPGAPHRSSC